MKESKFLPPHIRFDRYELAGSFGDIGTSFPLLTGMILACGLDVTSSLVMFGAMQILTGLIYGIPMPVQPLKAMAVIMITQKLGGNILYGGGLAVGVIMLFLSVTGLIDGAAKIVPKAVIRGIQLGLGIQLSLLALKDYVPAEGGLGYILALASFILAVFLLGNKKYPPALLIIFLGVVYALIFKINLAQLTGGFGFNLPKMHTPAWNDIVTGLVVLALPQIPLSIGNSILATRQTARDLFPEKSLSVRKISLTYALINIVKPFFSGIPVCHGSGGMMGHYTFGARTGGAVIICGSLYLVLGLFCSPGFGQFIQLFPKPVLGVILLFEGLNLMRLMQDMQGSRTDLAIAFLVGVIAAGLPFGYIVALLAGVILGYLSNKKIIKAFN